MSLCKHVGIAPVRMNIYSCLDRALVVRLLRSQDLFGSCACVRALWRTAALFTNISSVDDFLRQSTFESRQEDHQDTKSFEGYRTAAMATGVCEVERSIWLCDFWEEQPQV